MHFQRADCAGVHLPSLQGGSDDLYSIIIGRGDRSDSDAESDLLDSGMHATALRVPNHMHSVHTAESIHLLLGGAVGRRQAAGPPVLVDGRAVDHNGVFCSGIALGQDAIQHLVFHGLQEVHLQKMLSVTRWFHMQFASAAM